jgi:hypothetical protein
VRLEKPFDAAHLRHVVLELLSAAAARRRSN